MDDFDELTVNEAAARIGTDRLHIHWWLKTKRISVYRIRTDGQKTLKSTDVDRIRAEEIKDGAKDAGPRKEGGAS